MKKQLEGWFLGTSLRARLAQGAVGSLFLKGIAAGLGFLTSVILARLMGPAGYGAYAYAIAVVGVLVVAARLGLGQVAVRNMAAYRALQDWGRMRGLLHFALGAVLVASVCLALAAGAASWWIGKPEYLLTLWLALLLLPLEALMAIIMSTLRGLRQVLLSQIPEALVRSTLFLAAIALASWVLRGLEAPWAMAVRVAVTAVTLLVAGAMLWKFLPAPAKSAPPVWEARTWIRIALPMLFVGEMSVVNHQTDLVLIGAFLGAESVGLYRPVCSVVALVGFGLGAVNMPLGPTISGLFAKGEYARLQRVITGAARATAAYALPVTIGLIVARKWVLLIYGPEFVPGATALAILSVGHLLTAAIGPVGSLLTMTGFERDAAKSVTVGAVINVGLNLLLIPRFGIEGAAVATSVSLVAWRTSSAILVWRRLGLRPTVFGGAPRTQPKDTQPKDTQPKDTQ